MCNYLVVSECSAVFGELCSSLMRLLGFLRQFCHLLGIQLGRYVCACEITFSSSANIAAGIFRSTICSLLVPTVVGRLYIICGIEDELLVVMTTSFCQLCFT